MALFDDFLVLWNRADSEELERIANHVFDYIHFQRVIEDEREKENWKLHDEEANKLANSFGYVTFANSKVIHAVRFISPNFTYCNKSISGNCSFQQNIGDVPYCRNCEKCWWVMDESFAMAEEIMSMAGGFQHNFRRQYDNDI